MADSFTPTLNLTRPEINQSINTWGNKLNGDLDLLDQFAAEKNADIEDLQGRIEALEDVVVPIGLIALWSGAESAVPTGWALCNGSNGTPNLRDKFVVAAGPMRAVGSIGGADSQTVGTNVAGSHSHTGVTGATAISEVQMPSHQHGGATDAQGAHDHALPQDQAPYGLAGGAGGVFRVTALSGAVRTEVTGNHAHNIVTDFRGGSQGHTHGILGDGNHAHNVTVPTVPIYFALAYIMKIVLVP